MAQTILTYSESGLGKTTSIGLFARYQFNMTGKRTRLVTCDSGFFPCQKEVDEGIIIPLCLESAPYPIPVLNKLSRGEWPSSPIDVKRGLWNMGKGSVFVKDLTDTSAYAVEGLTRICELMRKALTDDQQQTGEPLQGQFEQMGEKFAFQSRGTLFSIQQLIYNIVTNFRGVQVDRVLWTGHEGKGKDINGRTVFGPATTGQALTDKVSGWFEIVLHHDSFQYQELSRQKFDPDGKPLPRVMLNKTAMRAWFQRHPDVELPKMYWPAKLGLPPELTAVMYDYFEEGFFPLIMNMQTGEYQQGLHTFLHIIDHNGDVPGALPQQPQEVEQVQTVQAGTDGETVEAAVEPAVEPVVAEPVEPKKGRGKR